MNAKTLSTIGTGRLLCTLAIAVFCTSCALFPSPGGEHGAAGGRITGGLAVGFVVNQSGAKKLKDFERRRYADQIAAQILLANPAIDGRIDSYGYVSRRLGSAFSDVVDAYRRNGSLEPRHRATMVESKLRRRYLMLVSISPVDEKVQMPPVVQAVPHKNNGQLADYELVRYQTARIKTVEVQVYDTVNGRRVLLEEFSSTDGGKAVVNERTGKRYKGNSLLAAVTNSLGNKLRYGGNVSYPEAPSTAHTLNYIWQLIAEGLPQRIRS